MSWKYVQRNDESGQYRTTDEGGGGGSSTFAGLDDVDFSNLQDGQVPKYNSQSQKWENADESGGTVTDVEVDGVSVVNAQGVAEISIPTPPAAPVQDVQVDGVSVVDAQGIADLTIPTPDYPVKDVKVNGTSVVDAHNEAQITSYKEITQSEYNALPASKLTDGVLYCIKDIDEGDNVYPPLIYSTEEREIGVWVDGKPLYQKTIPISFQTSNTEYDVDSSIETFMFVTDATFKIESGSSNGTNYGFYVSANDRVQIYYRPSNHKIVVMSVGSQLLGTGYVTYRYTKTTDTPGSGMWTSQGAVAHHYSTNIY